MNLTREQILAARKIPSEKVSVPEWGGDVYVRVMTGTERDAYEAAILADKDKRMENLRAKLVVRTATDADGKLLFSIEDVEELAKDSWLPLERVQAAAQRINRLSNAALEELKGNSEPSPGDAQS